MSTLTVITLTLNEAHNIGPCLESVRWADEILVIDSGSTDDTLALRARVHAATSMRSHGRGTAPRATSRSGRRRGSGSSGWMRMSA